MTIRMVSIAMYVGFDGQYGHDSHIGFDGLAGSFALGQAGKVQTYGLQRARLEDLHNCTSLANNQAGGISSIQRNLRRRP